MVKALVIPADGPVTVTNLDGYDGLKAVIQGWLEAIPWGPTATAYLDEDGKSKFLPVNARASALAHANGYIWDWDDIVGPLVIVGPADAAGDDTDVPATLAEEILRQYP